MRGAGAGSTEAGDEWKEWNPEETGSQRFTLTILQVPPYEPPKGRWRERFCSMSINGPLRHRRERGFCVNTDVQSSDRKNPALHGTN